MSKSGILHSNGIPFSHHLTVNSGQFREKVMVQFRKLISAALESSNFQSCLFLSMPHREHRYRAFVRTCAIEETLKYHVRCTNSLQRPLFFVPAAKNL